MTFGVETLRLGVVGSDTRTLELSQIGMDTMISIGLGLTSTTILARGGADAYGIGGFSPALVFDFTEEYYRTGGSVSTFDSAMTATRDGNATMVDSDGLLKWAPHNLALNSATPATQSITVVSGADYTVECTGVSIALSGAGTGTVTEGNPVEITASTTTLTLTVTGSTGTMWAYRSDLGGMVANPDTGNSYVPTTSAARYLPRRGHHVWNGTAWVNEGLLIENKALPDGTRSRTNLLLNSATLATQNVTVTAVPHTLHFTGTGTVTLSGVSTAGPLVGIGTGENNRVSLTFTPTAGTLIATVTGTVTNAQLEVGSTPSSYIPTAGATVTRAADILTVPYANLPWPTPNVIGPELVTNGTFDDASALDDWDANLATPSVVDGELLIENDGSGSGMFQDFSTETGKTYLASVTARAGTATAIDLRVYTGGSFGTLLASATSTSTSNILFEVVFTATTTSSRMYLRGATLGGTSFWDDASVREIDPLAVSIQMDGRMTYADTGIGFDTGAGPWGEVTLVNWRFNNDNYITTAITTATTQTGRPSFFQEAAGTVSFSLGTDTYYSPGINAPFNIASRHGSTFINGAVDGVALTANTTPVALPDLSATNLSLGYDYMGCLKTFRMWNVDITDEGLEEATT